MSESGGERCREDGAIGQRLLAALVTAGVLGIGLLVLQRWVAATFTAAIVLIVVWFVVVGVAALVLGHLRPGLRTAMLVTVAAIAVASVGIGYWTGFRKTEFNEDVAMAASRIPASDRTAALAGGDGPTTTAQEPPAGSKARAGATREKQKKQSTGPVELATGTISGADGHDGSGRAQLIRRPNGERVLTLTDLDVDPGPDVDVYLSSSQGGIDDAIDLGSLKGAVGNQQYEIPGGADLTRHENLVLYCIPFTTRIATAGLR